MKLKQIKQILAAYNKNSGKQQSIYKDLTQADIDRIIEILNS